MSEHTPGPWQIVPKQQAQSEWIVGDAEGGSIADCEPPGPWMSADEAAANARLIAAAPDLLAAAASLIGRADGTIISDAAGNRFRKVFADDLGALAAAIAKATGGGT
jgi:hypothetical protein